MFIPLNFSMEGLAPDIKMLMEKYRAKAGFTDYLMVMVSGTECAYIALPKQTSLAMKAVAFANDCARHYIAFSMDSTALIDGEYWLHDGMYLIKYNPSTGETTRQPIPDVKSVAQQDAVRWHSWSELNPARYYLFDS